MAIPQPPANWLILLTGGLISVASVASSSGDRDPVPGVPAPAPGRVTGISEIGEGVLRTAMSETTWFGGTQWDAVDQRWEALPDGIWTFETGVATAINADSTLKKVGLHSIMEGWVGIDYNSYPQPRVGNVFRRLSESNFAGFSNVCVGNATGVLGGNWSLWAGLTEWEASGNFWDGQGYGNDWNVAVAQTFPYSGGTVELSFSYTGELEDSYDFAYVLVDTGGMMGDVEVWNTTGSSSGRVTLTLLPGVHLPSVPQSVAIRFRVVSDIIFSDEDGYFTTLCGAFAIDDLVISGGIIHTADFEISNNGWESEAPPPPSYPGSLLDLSDIRSVSDLPPEAASIACDLGDSVLVMFDEGTTSWIHPCHQINLALSPWIDLLETGLVGPSNFVVDYGGFVADPGVSLLWVVQWSPAVPHSPELGVSKLYGDFTPFPVGCSTDSEPFRIDLPDWIPPHAEEFRIGLGVYNLCSGYLCDCFGIFDSTPWFDDIRIGVVRGQQVAITDEPSARDGILLASFRPNPFNGSGKGVIRFALPEEEVVRIEILDIAGRLVRVIYNGVASAGWNEVYWDGTNISGQQSSSGVYFYRLVTGKSVHSRKLVLIRG